VFTYLVDPDTQTIYQSGLLEFDADWKDEPKVGDRARGTMKVAGKKVRWEVETTEAKRPERIAFRSVESPVAFEFSTRLLRAAARRRFGTTAPQGRWAAFSVSWPILWWHTCTSVTAMAILEEA
jgi:hypothetical protein